MRDLEYYFKLPENRRKELRRMYRLWRKMKQEGAMPSEFRRLLKYSRIVARPAYRYYTTAKFECGIDLLNKKFFEKQNDPITEADILDWIKTLLEENR